MHNICHLCNRLLEESDKVTVKVTSTYHVLKSNVIFALDKMDMKADSSTLTHVNCQFPRGDVEGD